MKKLRNFIDVIRDFKKINFWEHSSWGENYKTFSITPSISFEWDTQCAPMVENGKIVVEGCREFTIFIEFLWFVGGMGFEFNWTIKNIEEFEKEQNSPENIAKNEALARKIDEELKN